MADDHTRREAIDREAKTAVTIELTDQTAIRQLSLPSAHESAALLSPSTTLLLILLWPSDRDRQER